MTHVSKDKFKESMKERNFGFDVVPSLSPENHIMKIFREVNYLLLNINTVFKHMDKEKFRKNFTTYIRPKLGYTSPVCQ